MKKAPSKPREATPPGTPEAGAPGFAVVGVGASAGGLEAFRKLLEKMPTDCGMAFVLVQHLAPAHDSLAAELLSKHISLPAVEVTDEMAVEPNHVYVIPPNRYLTISGKTLNLTEPVEQRGVRVPIDFFFRSLAEDQHERSIGILLSGAGSDGTQGVREIKAAGGLVIVQSPETAQHDSMPRSAIATGVVDCILPIAEMPDVLLRYVRHWYINGGSAQAPALPEGKAGDDLSTILGLLRARTKYDFACYKKGTLTRRIQRRMGLNHVEKMSEYLALLRGKPEEVTALYKDLLINVTNFFREPEAWEALAKSVIGPLVQQHGPDRPIRVWVPGCATGEEPYSLAITLHEQFHASDKPCDIQMFASDIDEDALAIARAGIYPENIAADVSPERLRQFFVKGEHTYRIKKEIRDAVVFAEQNLCSDPPFSKLDLISCRNLLIYLEGEIQSKIIALFHFALRDGGYLILGGSETIGQQHDLFEAVSRKHRIYRRIGITRHDRVELPVKTAGRMRREAGERHTAQEPHVRRLNALAQQHVMSRFAPACALINHKAEVLYLYGPVDGYLQLPAGELGADLIAMAREGLRTKLRGAVQQALRDDSPVSIEEVRVKRGGTYHGVRVAVEQLRQPREMEGLLLVAFEDMDGEDRLRTAERDSERSAPAESSDPAGQEAVVRQLEDELRVTREDLQSTIEELETSNEEFKAANEEVVSINEELQSSNEELETSKEELQSLNEELQTVNHQLQQKVAELESTNNDLANLLASTDVATIFLDRRGRLRRFTPATKRLLRVIDSDVGRPVTDLARSFTDEDLARDSESVLQNLVPIEKEVQDEAGRWYVRRIGPYRTGDDRIDGVVVTFTDVTSRRQHEQAVQTLNEQLEQRVVERTAETRSLLEHAPDAIAIVAADGAIIDANARTDEMFGYPREELIGQPIHALIAEHFRAEHRKHWAEYLDDPQRRPMGVGIEFMGRRKEGSRFSIDIDLNPMELGGRQVVVVSIRDVTERRRAHEARSRLAAVVEASPAAIIVATLDGHIQLWNRAAERLFGYTADEAQALGIRVLLPPDRRDEFNRIITQLRTWKNVQNHETVRLHKDGTPIDVALTASLVDDGHGNVVGVCKVITDVRERKRMEHMVAEAADQERQRIGRDVHDSIGQHVTGIGMLVAALQRRADGDAALVDLADKLERGVGEAKQRLRELSRGLFPVEIDVHGLQSALEDLAASTREMHAIDCDFVCPGTVSLESNFVATQLYLVAREAVHNAIKHAGARRIVIRLEGGEQLHLSVEDDGRGFVEAEVARTGRGIGIMRYRCGQIGAAFSINSREGGGTCVSCATRSPTYHEEANP